MKKMNSVPSMKKEYSMLPMKKDYSIPVVSMNKELSYCKEHRDSLVHVKKENNFMPIEEWYQLIQQLNKNNESFT